MAGCGFKGPLFVAVRDIARFDIRVEPDKLAPTYSCKDSLCSSQLSDA